MTTAAPAPADDFPESPLLAFDTLWLQVAGTVCNLQCTHCFISCAPGNEAHGMMDLGSVRAHLAEAERLGVREYYVTGGEPFLHKDILAILEACLAQGPVTVLTNGLLIRRETAAALRALDDATPYSLDVRISLDGFDAAENDVVRGAGTFDRILAALGHLAAEGLAPVVTVTEACTGAALPDGRERLLALLRAAGLPRPRLKVMPLLRLGAEATRARGYARWESLRGVTLNADDTRALQCATGRAVTSRGVFVCPILIESPVARLGDTLDAARVPFPLRHAACYTCHVEGLSCRT